ncbi:cation:proton antiporter [Thiohalorhabdus sp. Cl-TMA]|uniref:Cation:proton antiporter n=1 Tax=Thiohalorhabdus methylotrophus TaxID=3242694 RepID=A0ABV4U0N6_9GAMM
MSTDFAQAHALWITLVGGAVVLSTLLKSLLGRAGIPPLIGYLLLGFLLSLVDSRWGVVTEPVRHAFAFLADVGIIALLFRVGLDSHPGKLVAKLPRASIIWAGDIALSALTGFAAAFWVLDLALIPSLVLAAALTATSLGVAVPPWQEARALNSATGQLLVDVGELDDLSGVAFMALLLVMVPMLHNGGTVSAGIIGGAVALFVAKLVAFAGFCYLFARYAEAPLTREAARLEPAPGRMLTVAGVGLLIAALGGWLGFSLAIGALFAGLTFSRDPAAVRTEANFEDLYEFFVPFFFIGIGLEMEPASLAEGAGIGGLLLLTTVLAKVAGAGLPAWLVAGTGGAALIGVSMVPRAEITMVILDQGRQLGDWAVPPAVYAAGVVVTAGTCLITPLALRPLLQRLQPEKEEA